MHSRYRRHLSLLTEDVSKQRYSERKNKLCRTNIQLANTMRRTDNDWRRRTTHDSGQGRSTRAIAVSHLHCPSLRVEKAARVKRARTLSLVVGYPLARTAPTHRSRAPLARTDKRAHRRTDAPTRPGGRTCARQMLLSITSSVSEKTDS